MGVALLDLASREGGPIGGGLEVLTEGGAASRARVAGVFDGRAASREDTIGKRLGGFMARSRGRG
ncbi:hypothetical protein GS495_24915 [Rhodococcus hoagii]|nr:hypothetical protein [Prescottella equi]